MEPQTPNDPVPTTPAPIMDIARPPVSKAAPDAEATAPAEPAPAATPRLSEQKPPKTAASPIGAILLAIIFFVILSAIAYYAYTKTK